MHLGQIGFLHMKHSSIAGSRCRGHCFVAAADDSSCAGAAGDCERPIFKRDSVGTGGIKFCGEGCGGDGGALGDGFEAILKRGALSGGLGGDGGVAIDGVGGGVGEIICGCGATGCGFAGAAAEAGCAC